MLAAVWCGLSIGSDAVTPAATDPFVGTWALDRSRSSYESDTLPERMVIAISIAGQGIHYRSEAHYANGRVAICEYTADYDGTLAMVFGSAGLMAPVSLQRIDAHSVAAAYVRGLRVVASARRVTSEDGRRMTITTVSHDAAQHERKNVAVFERVS